MPGSDDLLRIIDAPLEVAELNKVQAKLMEMLETIKQFSGFSLITKTTSGAAEFRSQSTLLTEAMAKMKVMEEQLEAMRSANASKQKARTDQEIADTQRKAQATRVRVADIRAEEDAYKRLTNEYNHAATAAKQLAAQYGIHSTQARAAAKEANNLSEQIQNINKAAGDSRSGVGRYTQGIKDFVGQAAQMFGALYLIQKGFSFIKESVKDFINAEDSAARLNNILHNLGREDVLNELNKEAGKLAESLGTVAKKDVTETFQKLIVYGKLTKNQILELTPVIADFAAQQRTTLPEATDIITKALEGNARGLKQYGINIKEGHDASERFAIIMDQLKPKVDGMAKAFGDTLAGGMKKSEIATEELKVKIGEEFAPAIAKVEEAILTGVKGIPEMVSSFKQGFVELIDNAKQAWFSVKAIFGSPADLAEFNIQKADAQRVLESSKQMQNAREYAESFRAEAAKKSISDQEKNLAIQKQLMKSDVERYTLLKARGQLETQDGKYAIDQALKSISIVNALRAQLTSSKDASVLGSSDPNAGGDNGKKEAAALAKKRAAMLEFEVEYQKILADETNNTTASRIQAYKKINELEAKQDLSLEDRFKNEVDQIGRLAKIRSDALHSDEILSAANAKELESIAAAHFKAMAELQKEAIAKQLAYLEDAKNVELLANDRDFMSGKITKEEHGKKGDKINSDAQEAKLRDNVSNQTPGSDAYVKAELDLSTFLTNKKIADNDKVTSKRNENIDKALKYEQLAENTISSFIRARYENELNAIQKNIDANNKAKEKETAAIQNSTLSIQEKAAAEINLNASVNAKNEILQRQQRDVKIREAKFDRDKSIFDIIANTAAGVMKASPLIPLMALIAGTGAVELAGVIAKPIPTYAEGTENHPGGPMIVGEKGPEMRVDPSGKISMTPGIPTLTFGPKGTKIIPSDELSPLNIPYLISKINYLETRTDRSEEILQALKEANIIQIRAMNKKQPIHIHNHFNPGFTDHINKAVRN